MSRLLPLLVLLACAIAAPSAQAAGVTTHAFMAETAIEHVDSPDLRALLMAQREALLSGAAFPDGGYAASSFPGGDYGEVSHWETFVNAYAAHIRANCDPVAACAGMVAHMMGAAAHGMGDETWDWMFEPRMADYGESPEHPFYRSGLPGAAELKDLPPGSLANTSEYVMDMIAIVEHWRWPKVGLYAPPLDDLLSVYRAVGRDDVTREGLAAGHAAINAAIAGERAAAPAEYHRVRATMPRSSDDLMDAPGGVEDSARAIAGYMDALWRKLVDPAHPAPRVVGVNPEDATHGVTARWPARTSPGPRGGGAATRIIAVLSNAVDAASVTPATFRLVDPKGRAVPPLPGFPQAGPYHTSDGTHSIMFHPAGDLEPCTTYTAVVTTGLRDLAGASPARATTWRFRTGLGAGGPKRCPAQKVVPRRSPVPAAVAPGLTSHHTSHHHDSLATAGPALLDAARVRITP